MNEIIKFQFRENQVRTLTIDGNPWFIAKDVCEALGLSDTSKALLPLDDDEKGTNKVRTPGGEQEMLVINKPAAKPFRKWVTAEVLPSIRKTGAYRQPGAAPQVNQNPCSLSPVSSGPQSA